MVLYMNNVVDEKFIVVKNLEKGEKEFDISTEYREEDMEDTIKLDDLPSSKGEENDK